MTVGRLLLVILAGTATGLVLATLSFGPELLSLLLPDDPSLRPLTTFLARLADGRPLGTDLLALACLAAIPLFGVWDVASASRRKRDARLIGRQLGSSSAQRQW